MSEGEGFQFEDLSSAGTDSSQVNLNFVPDEGFVVETNPISSFVSNVIKCARLKEV